MAEMPEVKAWWKRSVVWRRLVADSGALAVGGNAAYLSWGHIVETSVLLHQPSGAAFLYPISIDGMMIVGVVKAADDRATGRKVRWWARVATWLGGGLSIQAQIMSALTYGWLAAAWAVVPSVTLIVVVEVQSRRGKPLVERATVPVVASIETASAEVPSEVPVAPVEPVTEPAPAVTESEPADQPVNVRPTRRPRRQRGAGHPGTGATGAQVDAAIEVADTMVTPVEPVDDAVSVV